MIIEENKEEDDEEEVENVQPANDNKSNNNPICLNEIQISKFEDSLNSQKN